MYEQPLDAPLSDNRLSIRTSSSTPLEAGLLALNGLIFFGLWMLVLWSWWQRGWGMVSMVLMVFVSVWTVFPSWYVWRWRTASLLYEQTGRVDLIRGLDRDSVSFFTGSALFFWAIYGAIMGLSWWSSLMQGPNSEYWHAVLLFTPAVALGPFQHWYLKKMRRLTQQVLAHHHEA